MATFPTLNAQTSELLRSGRAKDAQSTQAANDLLASCPQEVQDLYWATRNSKTVLESAADDGAMMHTAEQLKRIVAKAYGKPELAALHLRDFNEGKDFKTGREALQRMIDIGKGSARPDINDPKVQAAVLIGDENRDIHARIRELQAGDEDAIKAAQEARLQELNSMPWSVEGEELQKIIDGDLAKTAEIEKRRLARAHFIEAAKQFGLYPKDVEGDETYDRIQAEINAIQRDLAPAINGTIPVADLPRRKPTMSLREAWGTPNLDTGMGWEGGKAQEASLDPEQWSIGSTKEMRDRRIKDLEARATLIKDNLAYDNLVLRLAQNAALSSYLEVYDTLNPAERELIKRAFVAGQEGINLGHMVAEGGFSEDNAKRTFGATATLDELNAWEADNGRWTRVGNQYLFARIDPAHEETVRTIISLARGRIEEPQYLTDLFNRVGQSFDRTFGNIPRFIAASAKQLGYSIFANEDSYANYAEQARHEARREALWDAATSALTYEPGYGWFGDAVIGMAEQTPIWLALAAGGAATAISGGAVPGTQIAMGALAMGYAEDTRQQLILDGADPLSALVGGVASGIVQSWIERAQAEALIGKNAIGKFMLSGAHDAKVAIANAFYKHSLREFGTWQFAQAAFRLGGGISANGFLEAVEEGLQAGADRLISDLALGDPNFDRALKTGIKEFKDTFATMMVTAGFGGTVRVTRDVAQAASVGKQLRILTQQGKIGQEAEAALKTIGQTMDYAALREAWRNASNDRARIKLLMDVGHLPKTQATALHAYLIAEEKIADRHDALAMELAIDMSNEGAKTFANNPEAIRRVLTAIGLKDVQVEGATMGTVTADNNKSERDGWRVTANVGNGKTVTFTIGVLTEQESTLDGSAETASSAWEYLKNSEATQKEIKGMTQAQFTERWMSDEAWRKALINTYEMARRGESLILRKDSPYIVAEYTTPDGKTRKRKVSAGGAILLATGSHGRNVRSQNKTLAHETLHALVGLLRDTGVLTADSDVVKELVDTYGGPAKGVDELFNEEKFADALMEEAGFGIEAIERAAGEATRRKQNVVARALHGLADLFMGGGDFMIARDAKGNSLDRLAIREGVDRGAPIAKFANRANLARLLPFAQEAADVFNATERQRSMERLKRIREGLHERIAKRREEAAKQAEDEAKRQEREAELESRVDSDLSEMAKEAHDIATAELNTLRGSIEQAAADIRSAFSIEGYDPKDDTAKARLVREQGRKLIAHWRALKNRELELLRELADINIDPGARREYLIARENEEYRLQGRAAREALDAEKRRIKETPVTDGDTLLSNTRVIGHEKVESRESYIKRKMAENGWNRKTAIAQATHLYPEDMTGLSAPWANRQLYGGKGSHSPDTAAQALYDEGRLAAPTVDAFWDAVRGDIETISKSKKRDIDAAEAEVASALEWGKQRHRQNLADIEAQRDWREDPEAARSSIGGRGRGYIGNRWSVNAQNAMDRGMRTEAQVAQSLGISYMAWMDNRPFSGNGADNIIGVLDENGRDIHVSDLLDLSHEWHHVGKNYDEVTFVDPDEFHDVKTAGDIADKQDAGLFWLYTRMREYPRQIDRNKLSREEADQALAIENEMASRWAESVKPSRDAFVRAIASDADVDTLRALGDAFQKAMHEHKLAEDERTKALLGQIGNPNAYRNERPRRNSGVRSSIGGLYSGGPSAYNRPSLRAIGTNDAGRAYGWGLYATTERDMAEGYAGATWRELANAFRFGGKTYAELTQDDPESAKLIEGYTATAIAEKRARGYDPEALKRDLQRDHAWLADYLAEPENDPANMATYPQSKQDRLRRFQTRLQNVERLLQADITMTERGTPAVHEQLWWTNRPDGDESHLLTWDARISEENRKRVIEAVRSLGLSDEQLAEHFGTKWSSTPMAGEQAYGFITEAIRDLAKLEGDHEALASQLLARHDVDGTVRHFPSGGSIYVAFSDEHLQVVRRWIWDENTQDFALDRSFTPPPPTMPEARATIAANQTVRSSIGNCLTERTNRAIDAIMLRSVEAQEEKNPEKAPFVTRAGIIAIPRYDLFFIPDHPSVAYGLYYQLIDRVYPSDIEAGARILGLDVPLAYEALAVQLQHVRDKWLQNVVFGDRPLGAIKGGKWYVSDKRFNADMSTAEFVARIADIERWRNRLLGMAEAYDNGVHQVDTVNAKLPGIHLDQADSDAHWQEVVASTAFGKQRLATERQQRLTETEREALGNDEYKLPLEAVSTLATLEPVVRDQYDIDIETQKGPYGEGWARLTLPDGTHQSFKSNSRNGEQEVVEQIKAFLRERATVEGNTLDRIYNAKTLEELTKNAKNSLNIVDAEFYQKTEGNKLFSVYVEYGNGNTFISAYANEADALRNLKRVFANRLARIQQWGGPSTQAPRSSIVGRKGASRLAGTAHATRSLEEAQQTIDAIIRRHIATLPNDVRWEALPDELKEDIRRMTQQWPSAPINEEQARAIWRSLTLTAALLAKGRTHGDLLREVGWTLGPDGLPRAELQPWTLTDKAKRDLEAVRTKGRGRSATLDAYIDDSVLFEAYPELRDFKVRIKAQDKMPEGALGQAKPEEKEIILAARNERDVLESLYHETQHIIQTIEGFAMGDEPSTGMDAYSRSMGEVEARAAGARAIGEPGTYEDAVTLPRTDMLTGAESFFAHIGEAVDPNEVYTGDWVETARNLLGFPERFSDRRTEYNGGTDWTYETFDDGIRTFYAEYRDDGTGPRGVHGREEYVDEVTKRKVIKYFDHGSEVDHPVINERIVPGQGTAPRSSIDGRKWRSKKPPIEAMSYGARVGVFREAQRRPSNGTGIDEKRFVHVADLPQWAEELGLSSPLMANGRVLRKLAKRHDINARAFAKLIEAIERPVAAFIEPPEKNLGGRHRQRQATAIVLILEEHIPDRSGAPAPSSVIVLVNREGYTQLVTAYGMDAKTETKYVGAVNNGLMQWVDKERAKKLPLLAATALALDSFNGASGPSMRTIANPAGEVNTENTPRTDIDGREVLHMPRENTQEGADPRSSISGVEKGARAASLYFGRSPTQADITSKALIEAGLFASGRKQSTNKVIEAYRDIGVSITPEDAADVADRINASLQEQKEARGRKLKPGEEPRDKVFTLDAILAQAYDENWKKAEKEAFAKGVSGTFGAARQMAQDVQEAMEARRKEAEAVTGTAPAIIETEMGFDIEASLLAAPEQIKTKVEIGKQQKQTEEERKAALEEAKREDEATGPDGIAPEPTLEAMGFTESKLDELQKRRRELRDRLAKLEREREEKRKEAKKKYQEKKDEAQNAKQEEDNYLEYCENLRVALNGIAFDLDNPPSVREFVNLMILHVAERRAGKEIKRLRELREALADPLVVRDAARTLAQIAQDLANRLVPSAARELIVKKAMTLAAAETIGQVRALATGALLSIRNVRIRQGRTELRDAMAKMIQSVKGRGRTVVGKQDSERKVSGDLERVLDEIEKALTLGEAALESKRVAAYATLVGLSGEVKKEAELVDFRDYQNAMRTITAIDQFGAWRHMTLAGLDDLRVELERMINGGIEAHERKMRQMEAKINGFVQPLIDAMTQHAPDFKPDENAPLRERIANTLDRHLGLQSLLFEALIGKSTGETRQKAARAVRDLLNELAAASAKYEATLLQWRTEIQGIATKYYGSTRAFMERMHTPVPEDLRAHLTNRRTDAQEQAGREARQKTRITYGQALQLYASLVQRDYAQNARIHHRDGADFDALRRNLSDADVAFIAECSRFMKRIFPDLQAEYAEVTGVTVGTTPNYWPVKIDYPRSGLSAEVRAWTPIVAAMEPRRRNGLDFKEEVSAEQMLFGRLDEWARMLAYGKLGIISAAVFGNGDVINAITNSLGTKMTLRIQENIKTALMGPATKGDNFAILSTRWASAFAMSGNVGVAFKQFAGIPAFALKLGAKDTIEAWWGGVTRLADAEWDADWAILTASDAYKARYGGAGLNAEMRAALQGATPGAVGGATAKAYDLGFRLQSIADRAVAKPFAIAAFRKYREAYLREGLPTAEAQRRAVIDAWALVEDTQQSARPENQLQAVNTSRIVRMLTQFRSAPLQQLQWEMRAWAAFLRGEEGAKQKLGRVIFINHILTPLFWVAFDVLWQAALGLFGPGDEDDEEKMEGRRERRMWQWVGELALGAILGQLTAVPVLGGAAEATYESIIQNIRRKAEGKETRAMTTTELATAATDVPAIRSAADIAATVYNVGLAATEVEMRDVASEADDFLKTAIPAYRDLSKGAEQWGLGDLDNLWEEE